MKKNKNAFSLIIAMGLVLITSLLAYTILEFIIPFSKDIKGIENSTKSYYMANSGIENGLFFFSKREDDELKDESNKGYSQNYDYKYSTSSSGNIVPLPGKGNSGFNKDRNTIGVSDPIQLIIGYGFVTNVSDLKIDFRVPDLNNDLLNDIGTELLLGTSTGIINWQLVAPNDTLNSISTSFFTANKINYVGSSAYISLSGLDGKRLDGNPDSFGTFFTSNSCNTGTVKCVLKFSVINDLKITGNVNVPYLEWILNAGVNMIPLRYSTIEAEGKSTGFVKKLNIRVPQETLSEAFDFTVFQ